MTADVLRLGIAACLVAFGVFAILQTSRSLSTSVPKRAVRRLPASQTPVFLFDLDDLVDASASASALIADTSRRFGEFEALMHVLERQFPDLRGQIRALSTNEQKIVEAVDETGLRIRISDDQGLTRISLESAEAETTIHRYEEMERAAQTEELDLLRSIARDTPQLIWHEDTKGNLIWANAAYLSYADRQMPDRDRAATIWPGERLFADIPRPAPGDPRTFGGRQALQLSGENAEHWFDVTAVPQEKSVVYFATDANATVRAERAQQEFLQTLSKTFAQLSTGLAIFNRRRKLSMFNPALLDMTGLPFTFMSGRPTIDMVLDRLRETRKLPEPKNYITWREQFSALEAAAQNGTYCERWDLPDGQTYRVTGRPHPDGAIAFLFEDISAEVSLTRRFRTEIQTGQAVLDALPDAIAVFSNANTLVMTNAAYNQLWQTGGDDAVTVNDLRSALRTWRARSTPSRLWREIENFNKTRSDHPVTSDTIVMNSGRIVVGQAIAVSGGMTMIKFRPATETAPAVRLVPAERQVQAVKG